LVSFSLIGTARMDGVAVVNGVEDDAGEPIVEQTHVGMVLSSWMMWRKFCCLYTMLNYDVPASSPKKLS
jgi:hypothetical protein